MNDAAKIRSSEFSRRLALRSLVSVTGGIAMCGIAMSANRAVAAATKDTQKTVGYRGTPDGAAQCDNCTQFEAPSSCKTVEGTIAATGWCRSYAKQSA